MSTASTSSNKSMSSEAGDHTCTTNSNNTNSSSNTIEITATNTGSIPDSNQEGHDHQIVAKKDDQSPPGEGEDSTHVNSNKEEKQEQKHVNCSLGVTQDRDQLNHTNQPESLQSESKDDEDEDHDEDEGEISDTLPSLESSSKNDMPPVTAGGSPDGVPVTDSSTASTASSTSKTKRASIPPPVIVPYRDRSSIVIDSLTDSDKKTLRLYDDNAVIGGPFPVKLQIILKVTELLGQQHIISWLPHGRSFMIHRPREFEEKIMGEFFKQTKLSSFKRQLNLYDFQRVTRGTDCGSYYHEMFLKGKPLLAKRMIRRKIKGTRSPPASTENDHVPDFYSMPPVGGMTNRSMNANMNNMNMSMADLQGNGLSMAAAAAAGSGMMKRPPFMGNHQQDHLYGGGFRGGITGMGMVPDHLSSAAGFASGLQGQGSSHLLTAGGGGLHPSLLQVQGQAPSSLQYESLLNRQNLSSHQSLLQQQQQLQQLNTLQLQHQQLQQQQQQQLHQQTPKVGAPGDFMMSELQGTRLPQQMHDSYAATVDNLNSSYALAASALGRNFGAGGFTTEELAAAKQLNRAAGTSTLNYQQGW